MRCVVVWRDGLPKTVGENWGSGSRWRKLEEHSHTEQHTLPAWTLNLDVLDVPEQPLQDPSPVYVWALLHGVLSASHIRLLLVLEPRGVVHWA
jgi:hypothetical protein